MKEILKIYTEIDSGINDVLFRGGISISEFTYSSTTFNVVKQLSATLYHNECLDDFWTGNEYVAFKGVRYYIRKVPTWTLENNDTRYKYDVQFLSEAKILEDVYWYDTYTAGYATYYSESTKIMFMGDIKQFIARMNAALAKSIVGGGWNVVLAKDIISETKLVSMDKVYFTDALKYMYDTFNIPYYIVGKTIYVGLPTNVLPYTFEFGANKGLYGLTKTQANFRPINRITGIGSTENIPYYYPNLSPKREEVANWIEPQTNLMPPLFRQTNGVEKFYNALNNTYLLPDSTTEYYHFDNVFNPKAPSEHVQEFDDIKPTIQGITYNGLPIDVIKTVEYDTDDNDNIDIETGDVEHPYFKITLNPLGFDLFASASARGEMAIYMNTGNCGACSFRVMVDQSKLLNGDYGDSTNNSVTLILEKDINTYGTLLPNQQLKVKVGDKFVILYIDLPQYYIDFAENKLYDAVIKHLSENNKDRFNFQAKFDEKLLRLLPEIENQIAENTLIPIKYKSGGKNTDGTPIYKDINLNVQTITIKQDDAKPLQSYEIGLTDNVTITSTSVDQVNDKVDIVDKEIINVSKKSDEQARRNIKALKDSQKYLFDPDGYIKEDRLSAKTIQALIGVFGTDSGAYYLNDVKLITNVDGNPNAIEFTDGTLHHYLIKWGQEDTDNNFIWDIAPISRADLVSTQNYYVYIQANRNNNSAQWLVSTEQIQYDSSDIVYYFLVGNLLPVENGYRSQTFQKGLTYINGGDIKAGTISSFDGDLIFDLDRKIIEAKNGAEIRGNIIFTDQSAYVDENGNKTTIIEAGKINTELLEVKHIEAETGSIAQFDIAENKLTGKAGTIIFQNDEIPPLSELKQTGTVLNIDPPIHTPITELKSMEDESLTIINIEELKLSADRAGLVNFEAYGKADFVLSPQQPNAYISSSSAKIKAYVLDELTGSAIDIFDVIPNTATTRVTYIPRAGYYTLRVVTTATISTAWVEPQEKYPTATVTAYAEIRGAVNGKIQFISLDKSTVIGTNGFFSIWSQQEYFYFASQQGLNVRGEIELYSPNGEKGLRISDNGIEGIGTVIAPQADWNATDPAQGAIKNKPTSLPANGGNSATVGGKSASYFATGATIGGNTVAKTADGTLLLPSYPTKLPAEGGNADRLNVLDTRNDNFDPTYYFTNNIKSVVSEFKSVSALGLSGLFPTGYCQITTYTPWSDLSGGVPHQMAIQTSAGAIKRAIRKAISATQWGEWQLEVESNGTYPNLTAGNADKLGGFTSSYFKAYTDDKINDIKIGGLNILPNSKELLFGVATHGYDYKSLIPTQQIAPNTQYYFSSKIEILAGTPTSVTLVFYDKNVTSVCGIATLDIVNGQISGIINSNSANNIYYMLIYNGLDGSTTGNSIKLSNLKLEQGNKPTSWTPALEDTQADIDDRISKSQTTDQITNNIIRANDFVLNGATPFALSEALESDDNHSGSFYDLVENARNKSYFEQTNIAPAKDIRALSSWRDYSPYVQVIAMQGTVNGVEGTVDIIPRQSVTLSANIVPGTTFERWEKSLYAQLGDEWETVSTQPVFDYFIERASTFRAVLTTIPMRTIGSYGLLGGTFTINGDTPPTSASEGSVVTITAKPAVGMQVSAWYISFDAGQTENIYIEAPIIGQGTMEFTYLISKDVWFRPTFVPSKITITVTSANTDQGTVSGSGEYNANATANISATPKAGYLFRKWVRNGSDTALSQSFSYQVTQPDNWTAYFLAIPKYEYSVSGGIQNAQLFISLTQPAAFPTMGVDTMVEAYAGATLYLFTAPSIGVVENPTTWEIYDQNTDEVIASGVWNGSPVSAQATVTAPAGGGSWGIREK